MLSNIKQLKSIIKLRYDTEENFNLVGDSFVLEKGEACIVETERGLRIKIGDGATVYNNLP